MNTATSHLSRTLNLAASPSPRTDPSASDSPGSIPPHFGKECNSCCIHTNCEGNILQSQDSITGDEVSDAVLASQVARGQSSALQTLYDRYASRVLGIALRILGDRATAEDVLQETFWHVWRSATSYQSHRGPFTGSLFRIARDLAIDAYRRRSIRPRPATEVDAGDTKLDQISDPNMDVGEQSKLLLKHSQVASAMASLPVEQRQVIEMAYFCGMTRQEIAGSTGQALGTIHTRARLALQKLRGLLQSGEFED